MSATALTYETRRDKYLFGANTLIILIVVASALLSPVLGILWLVYLSSRRVTGVSLVAIVITIIFARLNFAKGLDSDLLVYMALYNRASAHDYLTYVTYYGKEPLYSSLSYIGSKLLSIPFRLYLAIITCAIYGCICLTARICSHAERDSGRCAVFTFLFLAFYFELFSLTAHLIRQVIAGAVSVFMLSKLDYSKRSHFLYILAPFAIHYSAIVLFVPTIVLRIFRKKSLIAALIGAATAMVIFYMITWQLPLLLSLAPAFLVPFLIRIGDLQFGYELEPLPISALAFLFVSFSVASLKRIKSKERNHPFERLYASLLGLIILITAFWSNPELPNRLYVYVHILAPLLLALTIWQYSSRVRPVVIPLLILLSIIRFGLKIQTSIWSYPPFIDVLG